MSSHQKVIVNVASPAPPPVWTKNLTGMEVGIIHLLSAVGRYLRIHTTTWVMGQFRAILCSLMAGAIKPKWPRARLRVRIFKFCSTADNKCIIATSSQNFSSIIKAKMAVGGGGGGGGGKAYMLIISILIRLVGLLKPTQFHHIISRIVAVIQN